MSTNLIVNGTFNTGNTNGWSNVQIQNSFVSTPGYNSTYAFFIGNYTSYSKLFEQNINTIVGMNYSLSYVLKNPYNYNFMFNASINNYVVTNSNINSSNSFDWKTYTFSFVASTTLTNISFFAKISYYHPSYCYIDDISVVLLQSNPTITNFSVPTKTYGNSSFIITPPTSNSLGSFSYTSSNTSVATISGTTITIVGAGTSIITATQAETTNYTSGTTTTTFQVNQASPTITNFSIPTKTYGDSPFTITQPTSNSSGSFSYTSSNLSVATIQGNVITIVGAGTSTITALQAATTNYTSGATTTTFQVNQATPTITNFSIPTKTYGDSPFTITQPTSNSSGSFSYTSSNLSVATIQGNTITIVGAGTSIITTTQAETTNYTSGTITAIFQVNQSTPTNPVIIDSIANLLYFMNTSSTYANIAISLDINYDLITSSYKVLTGNNIKITKSNN